MYFIFLKKHLLIFFSLKFIDINHSSLLPYENVTIYFKKLLIASEGPQNIRPEIDDAVADRVKITVVIIF